MGLLRKRTSFGVCSSHTFTGKQLRVSEDVSLGSGDLIAYVVFRFHIMNGQTFSSIFSIDLDVVNRLLKNIVLLCMNKGNIMGFVL